MAGGSFGIGSGPVFLSGVHCYGNEKTLKECIGVDFSDQSCPHSMDVGVICAGTYICNTVLKKIIIIIILIIVH